MTTLYYKEYVAIKPSFYMAWTEIEIYLLADPIPLPPLKYSTQYAMFSVLVHGVSDRHYAGLNLFFMCLNQEQQLLHVCPS